MMMRAPESTGFSTRVSSWNINLNLVPHFAYLMGEVGERYFAQLINIDTTSTVICMQSCLLVFLSYLIFIPPTHL